MRHDEIILVEFGSPKKGGPGTEACGHQDLEAAQRGKSQRWRRKPERGCQESHGKTFQGHWLPMPHDSKVTPEFIKWKTLLTREAFLEC